MKTPTRLAKYCDVSRHEPERLTHSARVPQREVEDHGLTEAGLADADEQPANVDARRVRNSSLTRRSRTPDEGADRDQAARVDLLGEQGAGSRKNDVGHFATSAPNSDARRTIEQ